MPSLAACLYSHLCVSSPACLLCCQCESNQATGRGGGTVKLSLKRCRRRAARLSTAASWPARGQRRAAETPPPRQAGAAQPACMQKEGRALEKSGVGNAGIRNYRCSGRADGRAAGGARQKGQEGAGERTEKAGRLILAKQLGSSAALVAALSPPQAGKQRHDFAALCIAGVRPLLAAAAVASLAFRRAGAAHRGAGLHFTRRRSRRWCHLRCRAGRGAVAEGGVMLPASRGRQAAS